MVPAAPQVGDGLFRQGGVAEGVGAGKVVIDMSSISPSATKTFAEKIKATGVAPIAVGAKDVHGTRRKSAVRLELCPATKPGLILPKIPLITPVIVEDHLYFGTWVAFSNILNFSVPATCIYLFVFSIDQAPLDQGT